MKLSEMNQKQRERTLNHMTLAYQIKDSKQNEGYNPKKEDNSSTTSTNTMIVGLQYSLTKITPHIKENGNISDKMLPLKTEERSVIPLTKMSARLKSDSNNRSNES